MCRSLILPASARGALATAAELLGRGRIVAFPTETVYGVAVRAGDARARLRLVRAKGRSDKKPFQLLVGSLTGAERLYGRFQLPARRLARAFWPGPLTLVVQAKNGRWVGLRVPDHPVALKLIRRAGGALVATSANLAGEPPAMDAQSVAAALGDRVEMILDGGPAAYGVASTVVRVHGDDWTLLREGAITRQEIVNVIGK